MLWRDGEPINVDATPEGKPLRVTWRGRTWRVQHIHNRWRVSEEWWRAEPAAWREYIKLSTQEGLACLVARDLATNAWWLIRLYD